MKTSWSPQVLAPCVLLLVVNRAALGEQQPLSAPAAQAIAERFVNDWVSLNGLKGKDSSCRARELYFNAALTGWYYSFRAPGVGASLDVSVSQKIVVSFTAHHSGLRTPQRKGGKWLSAKQQLKAVKGMARVDLAEAQKRSESFLAQVYPRFRDRDFKLRYGQLRVRGGNVSSYSFGWKEAIDLEEPVAYPNRIVVEVNPVTGIVCSYSAQDYSLPRGFKIVLEAREAVAKAKPYFRERLRDDYSDLPGKTQAKLHYVPARRLGDKDRICWYVDYYSTYTSTYVCVMFDVTTGERVRDPEEGE